MESLNRRTDSNSGVAFEYSDNVLAVGARTAVLDDVSDRSEVLQAYFDLVAEQRSAPLSSRIDLRDRDLVSLATILDLPAIELERYIDRELARFVATTTAERRAPVAAQPKGMRKLLIGLLMLGVAVVAAAGATVVAHVRANAQPVRTVPLPAPLVPVAAPTADGGGTARVEPNPNGPGSFVVTDSPGVPAQADGTAIGGAQVVVPQP
jgi:hypothetical protein